MANTEALNTAVAPEHAQPAPPPAPPVTPLRTRILQVIIALTRIAAMPPMWEFIKKLSAFRQLCGNPEDLVAGLQREFSNDQLLAERIVYGSGDKLYLNKVFGDATNKFAIAYENDLPVDAFSSRGALYADVLPSVRYFEESFAPEDQQRRPTLAFLMTSDDDLQVGRGLGLTCSTAAGMAEMSGSVVRKILCNDSFKLGSRKFCPVLCGFHLGRLEHSCPSEVITILDHFARACDAYDDLDTLDVIGIWQPSAQAFRRITSAAGFHDKSRAFELVWESASKHLNDPLVVWQRLQDDKVLSDPVVDFSAARKLVRSVRTCPGNPALIRELNEIVQQIRLAIDDQLVDGHRQAARLADPSAAALHFMMAKLMEHVTQKDSFIRDAEAALQGRLTPPRSADELAEELDQNIKIANCLVQIHRELTPK